MLFKEQKMFSGDCYHTEIKIYLKQRKKRQNLWQNFTNKAVHELKCGMYIVQAAKNVLWWLLSHRD